MRPSKDISEVNISEIIAGFDPGLRATGWGVIRRSKDGRLAHIASGTIKPDVKAPLAERLFDLEQQIDRVFSEYQPMQAAIEKAFAGVSISSAFLLGQARAACLIAAARAGVPIAEYAPTAIKKAVIGFGRADKHQITFIIGKLLPGAAPETDHAADALAIALCHGWRAHSALRAAS